MKLSWNGYELDFGQRTYVMGVLNVTPDSFSDGGKYFQVDKAVERALQMVEEGADIIDIGGESTRPYSRRVSAEEELDRVLPVIKALAGEVSVPISIDTYKAKVAEEALKFGASIINDISALRFDPNMGPLAAEAQVPVILMHMKGRPEDMQEDPKYQDLMGEIKEFLRNSVERAVSEGVREEMVVLDPGIGFGKTFDHNLQIIRGLRELTTLGRPILVGTSNKAFIGHILGRDVHERTSGTMATIAISVMNGANIVRVHNVREAADTVKMADAIKKGKAR